MKPVRKISTDEVRTGYSTAAHEEQLAGTEFDLWLVGERKRVAAAAASREQQRIIELLEAEIQQVIDDNNKEMDWDDHREWGLQIAVALIKGENK